MKSIDFLAKSKQIVWLSLSSDNMIIDCSLGFLKLFSIRKKPIDSFLLEYFPNWEYKEVSDGQKVNFKINNNLLYEDINLTYIDQELGYELIGDLPNIHENNVVTKMSIMNQDYMILTREIDRKNKELNRAILNLKKAQSQLIQEERMAGLGRIAAGIAHEINNPLAIVMGNIDYLNTSVSDIWKYLDDKENGVDSTVNGDDIEFMREDSSELISDVLSGLERIKTIVSAFREYSDIDNIEDLSSYRVNEGIENILMVIKQQYIDKIDIKLSLKSENNIMVEIGEFNQVITHIIENAILSFNDILRDDKAIMINSQDEDEFIKISVSDNGIGMDELTLSHIFDPFFTTRDVGQGTGLGLTICHDIITRKYKGSIKIDSCVEKGTRVEIYIPINMGG